MRLAFYGVLRSILIKVMSISADIMLTHLIYSTSVVTDCNPYRIYKQDTVLPKVCAIPVSLLYYVKDLSTKERVDLYVLLVYAHLKHNDALNVDKDF